MTKAERIHLAAVQALGCVLCRVRGIHWDEPVEVHHLTSGGRRVGHFATIPLCLEHHRGNTGRHGLGRKGFEKLHGVTEDELLKLTNKLIGGTDGHMEQLHTLD